MNIKKMLFGSIFAMAVGIAHADVAVVVSKSSSVSSLSASQVSDIYLGKNLSMGGGTAVPVDLQEGSSAREQFYSKATGKTGAQVKAYWAKMVFTGTGTPPKDVPAAGDVKKFVNKTPNGIGYIDSSDVDDSVKVVHTLK